MNLTPKLPAVQVIALREAPWFCIESSEPGITPEVVAAVTMHVAEVRMTRRADPIASSADWLNGVASGYLYAAVISGTIGWEGDEWRAFGPLSFGGWLAKVWNRMLGARA